MKNNNWINARLAPAKEEEIWDETWNGKRVKNISIHR